MTYTKEQREAKTRQSIIDGVHRALGHRLGSDPEVHEFRFANGRMSHSSYNREWFFKCDEGWRVCRTANYLTDIAAAIGALGEFCKIRDYRWDLLSYSDGSINCTILGQTRNWNKIEKDIPAAICSAILASAQREGKE